MKTIYCQIWSKLKKHLNKQIHDPSKILMFSKIMFSGWSRKGKKLPQLNSSLLSEHSPFALQRSESAIHCPDSHRNLPIEQMLFSLDRSWRFVWSKQNVCMNEHCLMYNLIYMTALNWDDTVYNMRWSLSFPSIIAGWLSEYII